jgi:hypothetical protein
MWSKEGYDLHVCCSPHTSQGPKCHKHQGSSLRELSDKSLQENGTIAGQQPACFSIRHERRRRNRLQQRAPPLRGLAWRQAALCEEQGLCPPLALQQGQHRWLHRSVRAEVSLCIIIICFLVYSDPVLVAHHRLEPHRLPQVPGPVRHVQQGRPRRQRPTPTKPRSSPAHHIRTLQLSRAIPLRCPSQ